MNQIQQDIIISAKFKNFTLIYVDFVNHMSIDQVFAFLYGEIWYKNVEMLK